MADARHLFGTPREWAIDLAVFTALGVFLGVIGPFGTFYGGPAGARIAYWVANMWIGFLVLSSTVRLSVVGAHRLELPEWLVIAAGVAFGAFPLAIFLDLFAAWVWPPTHGRISPLLSQYWSVLMISEPFALGFFFLGYRDWRPPSARAVRLRPAPLPPASSASTFLDRLPPRLGRDLVCLQMEDHYVRAHTGRGSDLVLIPLKEAVAELGDTDGLQVHRSWWVARAAVVEPRPSGRNLALRLTNGLDVPVSRTSVAKLRAAGWLAER
jgi:hypothetical protein